MRVTRDIVYRSAVSSEAGVRTQGDLFLPPKATGSPVLLIHGGGWNALSKESLEPIALWLAERGRAVFSTNYRLLNDGPWPACRDDCVAAGQFMLRGGLARNGLPRPERILVAGASAGGHLAMTAGLRLPAERVEAIVTLAGPSIMHFPGGSSGGLDSQRFFRTFFGQRTPISREQFAAASPVNLVRRGAPPLYCIHSRNDQLVPPLHSEHAAAAWRNAGSRAYVHFFNGPGDSHGLWDSDDRALRQPIAAVQQAMADILADLARHNIHSPEKVA